MLCLIPAIDVKLIIPRKISPKRIPSFASKTISKKRIVSLFSIDLNLFTKYGFVSGKIVGFVSIYIFHCISLNR